MPNTPPVEPRDDLKFLRVTQVAELLAISRLSVYRLIERGLLPFYRVCRCVRIKYVDILDFLARNRASAWRDELYGGQKN